MNDTTQSNATWKEELLDHVGACQSAYHIESTPNHRFAKGASENLLVNREELVNYVEELISEARREAIKPALRLGGLTEATQSTGAPHWRSLPDIRAKFEVNERKNETFDLRCYGGVYAYSPTQERWEHWNAAWHAAISGQATPTQPGAPQLGGLTDEQLERMRVALNDSHVVNRGRFVAFYRDFLARVEPAPASAVVKEYLTTEMPVRPVVPDGWRLVPVEPTEEMFIAGMEADLLGRQSIDDETHVRSIWNAVIAAAPQPGEKE